MLARSPTQKYAAADTTAVNNFVQQGFAIYEGVFNADLIQIAREHLLIDYDRLAVLSRAGAFPVDVNGWSVAIMDAFARTSLYDQIIYSPGLIEVAKQYVGPDVAWLGHDGLFINVPTDTDPVLVKGQHTDVWTGTGVNTVFAALFFTDCDPYNGLSVCPGSHLQGLLPVRNRAIHPDWAVPFEQVNLDMVRAGDLVVWHALLIHSTTGHSDKNIRISMTSRFRANDGDLTSQERALGTRALSVGPLNQVLRLVGNDRLTPLRTYGGYVGVDRRMARLYDACAYKDSIDYDDFLGVDR